MSSSARAASAPLDVIHITDLHLHRQPDSLLDWQVAGSVVATDWTLTQVLDEIAADGQAVDLVLATGDLAQEPAAATYARMTRRLASIGCPVRCLPGNHDDAHLLRAVVGEAADAAVSCARVVDRGRWRFVLLDSSVPGQAHGRLPPQELALLERALRGRPQAHVLIALHHPPLPVGSPWLDQIGLRDAQALHAILDRHPQVRAVLFGHAHQAADRRRGGVRYLGSPSTCIQFAAGRERLAIDALPPAYRRLRLHADGRIDTAVHYVGAPLERLA